MFYILLIEGLNLRMFEARFSEAGLFKRVVEAIKDLVTEATWDCYDTGISLKAMDTSHVSLVSLNLRSDGFDRYRCDKSLSVGMNLNTMMKILRCSNQDDALTITAENVPDVVKFVFESEKIQKTSDYIMNLLELNNERLGVPEADYIAVVKIPSTSFQRIIKDLSQFSDTIVISCVKGSITFEIHGDIENGSVTLSEIESVDEEESITTIVKEPMILSFASHYLCQFTKATGLSSRVVLSMSPNVPLVVKYDIGDHGKLEYFLAPKLEEDD